MNEEESITSTALNAHEDVVSPPSYIKTLSESLVSSEAHVVGDGSSPTVLKGVGDPMDSTLTSSEVLDETSHHEERSTTGSELAHSEEPQRLTIESLTELLERISLTPWRINTYDDGQGQILWLQNGSHLDYNPSGDLILGGENQDETRVRLSHVGINV